MQKNDDILIHILGERAQREPEKVAFIYLEQGEVEVDKLTYAQLDQQARKIANCLLQKTQPGERVLLVYPPGLDFIRTFYGCLYAGVIPIPTNAPGRNRSLARLLAIGADAQATLALTTPNLLAAYRPEIDSTPSLRHLDWLDQTQIMDGDETRWTPPRIDGKSVAFIQYTSGSTSTPRGVIINYHNLSHNKDLLRDIRKLERGPNSVIINWPPQFHDMGLLVGVVQGIFDDNLSVMMSPIAFIQRPARWLEAITRYHGTFSGGPNFSYELCINKVTQEELERLDLSSWHMAYNSAEPIRVQTQNRFFEKFKTRGFRYESFHPAYGLAEATLVVSGFGGASRTLTYLADRAALEEGRIIPGQPDTPGTTQSLVNCGAPLHDAHIRIVDPLSQEACPPDKIGEIWVSADNIAQGYWNRPEESQRSFQARIKGAGDDGRNYLRTGDLGFMHDGNLYVTGRYKDMIIMRGRNYYPQDIEYTVEKCHPAIQPGSGAAFYIKKDGNEHLVVMQELRRTLPEDIDLEEVLKTIRLAIAREHGIRASAVVIIPKGSIPKTSSGKIQRHQSLKLFTSGQVEVIAEWRAPTGL